MHNMNFALNKTMFRSKNFHHSQFSPGNESCILAMIDTSLVETKGFNTVAQSGALALSSTSILVLEIGVPFLNLIIYARFF